MPYNTLQKRTPENVPGKYYVTDACTNCGRCREIAPSHFAEDKIYGCSHVQHQPSNARDDALCDQALEKCPSRAIWADGDSYDWGKVEAARIVILTPKERLTKDLPSLTVILVACIMVVTLVESHHSTGLSEVLIPGVVGMLSTLLFIPKKMKPSLQRRQPGLAVNFLFAAMLLNLTHHILRLSGVFTVLDDGSHLLRFIAIGLLSFTVYYFGTGLWKRRLA